MLAPGRWPRARDSAAGWARRLLGGRAGGARRRLGGGRARERRDLGRGATALMAPKGGEGERDGEGAAGVPDAAVRWPPAKTSKPYCLYRICENPISL